MELPEQDKQAFIDAARRRTQPQEGGAAFKYPSSGKRPEKLNVSRDVNMPAQMARGWAAGTLGLPGDIESLGRMGINLVKPGAVAEESFLPTSEFYQEYLPGGDERPAAKFASGLGALTGGAGATKVAGAGVKGAQAVGKTIAPKVGEMAQQYMHASGLAPQLTAYHGTPHKFAPEEGAPLGKFKAEKIGTGEGAQAFGHGIYFAENPKVAGDYRFVDASIDPYEVTYKGKSLESLYESAQAAQERAHRLPNGPSKNAAIDKANAEVGFWESLMTRNHPKQVVDQILDPDYGWQTQVDFVKKLDLDKFGGLEKTPGHLYTVDIPDEMIPRMLDWDKPLSQQSPEVRKILLNHPDVKDYIAKAEEQRIRLNTSHPLRLEKIPSASMPFDEDRMFGKDVITAITQRSGAGKQGVAEEQLQQAGIPGIQYLDAGSRDTGKGTRNFVVFPGEEEKVKILERKAEGGLVTDTDAIAAKLKATGMDDEKALMQALRMADARQEAHMALGGLAKLGKGAKAAEEAAKVAKPAKAAAEAPKPIAGPQAKALETARKNAVKAGLSPDPKTRMLQLGFGPDWYHGSSGDIKAFRPDYLGESTGAQSAKKAYFFARDPQNPPPEMLEKSRDPKILQAFKRAGFSDEELAKLNEVSMKGHGAETASGYSAMGGSREYKEAMRKANAAEKAGKWDEYEKWMGIAEDSAIGRNQAMQRRVAEYGEKLDVMLDRINNTLLNKPLPQEEAVTLDAKMKQLMPYGWYNSYSLPQMAALKGELVKLAGPDAAPALKSIDDFMSVKANRMLEETYEEGSNVMPVALRYKNPMVHDYGGSSYRDESYSDLIDQAQALGHDALILKNTFDPGRGPAKLVDVAAVFKPEQVRSRFAAFDPARINESDLLGAADPALLAGVAVGSGLGLDAIRRLKKEEQKPEEQKKAKGGLAKRV